MKLEAIEHTILEEPIGSKIELTRDEFMKFLTVARLAKDLPIDPSNGTAVLKLQKAVKILERDFSFS